jgi:hypothetical protein
MRIKINLLGAFILFVIVMPIVSPLLELYPEQFIQNEKINVGIVVGSFNELSDLLSAEIVYESFNKSFFEKDFLKILDEEGYNKLKDKKENFILIGGPCANKITSKIINKSCGEVEIEEDEAIIEFKIIEGKNYLIVFGYEGLDTRIAAWLLTNKDPFISGTNKTIKSTKFICPSFRDLECEGITIQEYDLKGCKNKPECILPYKKIVEENIGSYKPFIDSHFFYALGFGKLFTKNHKIHTISYKKEVSFSEVPSLNSLEGFIPRIKNLRNEENIENRTEEVINYSLGELIIFEFEGKIGSPEFATLLESIKRITKSPIIEEENIFITKFFSEDNKEKKIVFWISDNYLIAIYFDFIRKTESSREDVLLEFYKKLYTPSIIKETFCEEGCLFNEICIPHESRILNFFCSPITNKMEYQVEINLPCEEDYECKSELCFRNECKGEKLIFFYRVLRLFR